MTHPIISSEKVVGTAVYNDRGDKLGSIDDIMIDKLSGQVRYAVLEFGGFLGVGTDRYPLPWSTLKYDTRHDGYVIALTKEQLEGGPKYPHAERKAGWDDDYGRHVSGYYGVAY